MLVSAPGADAQQRDYFAQDSEAQQSQMTYADLAALTLDAPMVLRVKIKSSAALKPERAPGLAPGDVRLYVTADVQALVAGPNGVPFRVTYLVDLPRDARGRAPKIKNQIAIIFARTVPGRPSEIQLVAPDAQIPWTPDIENRTRAIVQEKLASNPPPRVTGIREALYVPGNLVGESETQIFLDTQNGDPVSITVVRRPGIAPEWGVSFSEIVDQAAQPPQKNTLAWYRLACGLPETLPPSALIGSDAASAQFAAQDYQLVRRGLGQCERTRTQDTTNF
jgi:hypothetical protein